MIASRQHFRFVGTDPDEDSSATHEDTCFDITFDADEIRDNYCQLHLSLTRHTGNGSVTIDWGDGTIEDCTDFSPSHNYTRVGRFTVRIGKQAKWFRLWSCYTITGDGRSLHACPQVHLNHWCDYLESCEGTFCGWSESTHGGLVGTLPRWGRSITNTRCCFQFCFNITGGFPKWTANIVDATATFDRCKNLEGNVPEWGANITKVTQCYSDCPGACGPFPAWPPRCTEFDSCFKNCPKMSGPIPPWPETAESMNATFENCPGAVGSIPPWPPNIRDLSACYKDCPNLTGAWTDDPALLMPEEKLQSGWMNRSYDVVTGCADSLRALFWDRNWGGTIPRPIPLPEG